MVTVVRHRHSAFPLPRRRHNPLQICRWILGPIAVLLILGGILHHLKKEEQIIQSANLRERLEEAPYPKQRRVHVPIREGGEEGENSDNVITPDWLGGEWENEECIPFAKWQLMEYGHSTCNMMHEMDISEPGALQFINCGGDRCAFSFTNQLRETIVLKWTK
jgi:hypothetical protein